eukprot:383870-Prorocentrum_minimum.AAC.1
MRVAEEEEGGRAGACGLGPEIAAGWDTGAVDHTMENEEYENNEEYEEYEEYEECMRVYEYEEEEEERANRAGSAA